MTSTTERRRPGKAATEVTPIVAADPEEECDRDPPAAAAAFVASASAAVFVLLVALLAVVLSTAALWTIVSALPTAVAAADVHGGPRATTDYLHRWHRTQQEHQVQRVQREPSYLARNPLRRSGGGGEDAQRRKRQLLKFKKSHEPGVIALTFSLIGGTVSDIRQAFRNVSGIVRDTINEAGRPATTTAVTGEGDQMMAAGNAMENEIGGSTTLAPVDNRQTGNMLGKLLGRNYRGLRRLFNSELRSAIKSSPGNVRDFAVELIGSIGQSLRPSRLLTRGPMGGNSTSAATAAPAAAT